MPAMSIAMTSDERQRFLAELHVGILSIPDGEHGPLTCPIWYEYEPGGEVSFVTGADSRKARLLRPGRRVSFCAQQESLPPKYVTLEGPIVAVEAAGIEDVRRVARRYLGAEVGDRYVKATRGGGDGASEVRVRVRPERWLSADFAKRFAAG
jgi:hypothetical protein